jgi:Mitochondrial ribosomal protein (VAR1)
MEIIINKNKLAPFFENTITQIIKFKNKNKFYIAPDSSPFQGLNSSKEAREGAARPQIVGVKKAEDITEDRNIEFITLVSPLKKGKKKFSSFKTFISPLISSLSTRFEAAGRPNSTSAPLADNAVYGPVSQPGAKANDLDILKNKPISLLPSVEPREFKGKDKDILHHKSYGAIKLFKAPLAQPGSASKTEKSSQSYTILIPIILPVPSTNIKTIEKKNSTLTFLKDIKLINSIELLTKLIVGSRKYLNIYKNNLKNNGENNISYKSFYIDYKLIFPSPVNVKAASKPANFEKTAKAAKTEIAEIAEKTVKVDIAGNATRLPFFNENSQRPAGLGGAFANNVNSNPLTNSGGPDIACLPPLGVEGKGAQAIIYNYFLDNISKILAEDFIKLTVKGKFALFKFDIFNTTVESLEALDTTEGGLEPNIKRYVKSLSLFNTEIAGYQNTGYFFNRSTKTYIDNTVVNNSIFTILDSLFFSMSCLISKPVFVNTPKKLKIQLFYYLKRENNYFSFGHAGHAVAGLAPKGGGLGLNLNKLNILTEYLTKFYKKPVELELNRLYYPYFDSNILSNFIGLISNNVKLRYIFRNLFKDAKLKKPANLISSASRAPDNYPLIPAYLSGMKIKIAGRLLTQRIKPRLTVKITQKGTLARGKANFLSKARFTDKNKRGAYSISITLGHIFF